MTTIDKYTELKIASSILKLTISDMANELDVSTNAIRGVCSGNIRSARVEKYVDTKIRDAKSIYNKYQKGEQS